MSEKRNDREIQSLLLGYHLGLTDAEDSSRVEARFANSEELAEARRSVQRTLAPLDKYEQPSAPPNLVAGIMARVDAERGILKFPTGSKTPLPTEAEVGPGSGPLLPFRELVGLAAAVLLFVGILVPGYRTARSSSQRAMCAGNMRQMGVGYANYAEANQAFLPFTSAVPQGASWVPAEQSGAPQFSNSQHAYLLVKYGFVPAHAFNCPGRSCDAPMHTDDPSQFDDFPSVYNNSYTTNLMTSPWRQQEFQPDNVLAGDMTPLVDENRRLIRDGNIPLNSTSHGSAKGQNILRADLSVRWATSPNVGIDSDDIYRVIGVQRYTGQERPQLRSDAFLVP